MNRAGSLLSVFFTHGPVETYKDVARSDLAKFRTYFASMLESGIYIAPSQFEAMFVGGAHDESDLQKTAAAIDRAFAAVAEG